MTNQDVKKQCVYWFFTINGKDGTAGCNTAGLQINR